MLNLHYVVVPGKSQAARHRIEENRRSGQKWGGIAFGSGPCYNAESGATLVSGRKDGMKKTFLMALSLIAVLLLASCAQKAAPSKDQELFSTLSPDKTVRLAWEAGASDAQTGALVMTTESDDAVVMSMPYPSDTVFTALWSEDSRFCTIGSKSQNSARLDIFSVGVDEQTVYTAELSSFVDSVHPENPNAFLIPVSFVDNSTLLLMVDWIDGGGNRKRGTCEWNFIDGTHTEMEMQDSQ